MKVRVSRTVKAAFGKRWKQELKNLLEAGCMASEGKATSSNRRHDADSFHSQQEKGRR